MLFCEELYEVGLKIASVSKGQCWASFCKNQRKDEFYRRNLKNISIYPPAHTDIDLKAAVIQKALHEPVICLGHGEEKFETGGTEVICFSLLILLHCHLDNMG